MYDFDDRHPIAADHEYQINLADLRKAVNDLLALDCDTRAERIDFVDALNEALDAAHNMLSIADNYDEEEDSE